MNEYGAHYGFAICLGYDGKIWYCTTANVSPLMIWPEEFSPCLREHLKRVLGKKYSRKILVYRHLEDIFGAGRKEKAKQNTYGIRNKIESFDRIASKLAEEDCSGHYPVIAMFSSKSQKHCIVHPDPDKYPEMARLKDIVLKVVASAEKKIPTNYPPFTNGWLRSMSNEEKIESLKLTSIPSREHLKRGVKRKSFVPMSTF